MYFETKKIYNEIFKKLNKNNNILNYLFESGLKGRNFSFLYYYTLRIILLIIIMIILSRLNNLNLLLLNIIIFPIAITIINQEYNSNYE